jgi:O-antigen/teichoic acid export membrane protein
MSTARRVAKNTSLLFVANIISYAFVFFTTFYAARYLGAEGFGILSLALALTGIFGALNDLGLSSLTIREVARNKTVAVANKYIANTALMKVFLAFLTVGLVFLTVHILGYPANIQTVIYIVTASVIFKAFYAIFNSIFQAFEKMQYLSISIILNAVLTLSGVLLVIHYGLGVTALAFIYPLVSIVILVCNFFIYVWKFTSIKIEIDFSFWKPTLKESLFFGLSSILVVIYFYINSVMLSVMVGNSAVGIYNAAYNLIMAFLVIPSVVIVALFPVMSHHFESFKDFLKVEYEKAFKYLFAIGMFILIYVFIFADKIITIIYGSGYTASIVALQALIFVIPVMFITVLFGNLLGAINRQRFVTIVAGANALLNVTLNLLLIPKFSYVGAGLATVFTESLGFTLMFIYISRYFFRISLKQNVLKTVITGVLVTLIVYYLKTEINWILAGILGVFIYLAFLYLLRMITKEDIQIFRQIVRL